MTAIPALTVLQPWAALIAHGGKDVENRTWPTRYRGPIAIHAGRTHTPEAGPTMPGGPLVYGAILAVAILVEAHPGTDACSRWAEASPAVWHWVLTDVRVLPNPIPCRGRQRLWTPEPAVQTALRTELDRAPAP